MRRHLLISLPLLLLVCGCDQGERPSSGRSANDVLGDLQDLGYVGGVGAEGGRGAVFRDEQRMQPGYTLVSIFRLSMAKLIDEDGTVVHTWRIDGSRNWDNVELLPNGDILTTGADPYPTNGIRDEERYLLRMSWRGEVIWKHMMFAHHDVALGPDGQLLTLTFQRRSAPEIDPSADLRDDLITRLDPGGRVLDTISMYDLTRDNDLFPLRRKRSVEKGGRKWIDLFHCNSVEQMSHAELFGTHRLYAPEHVLICSRHQNRIAIVNLSTKSLVWAWGIDELDGPHDATLLPSGNILVFDNGLFRGWSRVLEIDPRAARIVWKYEHPDDAGRPRDAPVRHFYTGSKGSNQRLDNGNTLICNADNGEVFEVTPDGEVVWRYLCDEEFEDPERPREELRASLVRAYRYDREFIDAIRAAQGD